VICYKLDGWFRFPVAELQFVEKPHHSHKVIFVAIIKCLPFWNTFQVNLSVWIRSASLSHTYFMMNCFLRKIKVWFDFLHWMKMKFSQYPNNIEIHWVVSEIQPHKGVVSFSYKQLLYACRFHAQLGTQMCHVLSQCKILCIRVLFKCWYLHNAALFFCSKWNICTIVNIFQVIRHKVWCP